METERQIEKGKEVIRSILRRHGGKKRHRVHLEAAEDNVHRLRALEGICGNCKNVKVEIVRRDGKDTTSVYCRAGHSPLELYYDTPLGEYPGCIDFTTRS